MQCHIEPCSRAPQHCSGAEPTPLQPPVHTAHIVVQPGLKPATLQQPSRSQAKFQWTERPPPSCHTCDLWLAIGVGVGALIPWGTGKKLCIFPTKNKVVNAIYLQTCWPSSTSSWFLRVCFLYFLLQRSICSYYLPICTWFFKGTGSHPIGFFHITLRTHLFSFSAETISLLHISLLVCLQDLSEVRKAVSEGETSSCFRTDRYELRVPLRWVSICSIKSLNADDAVTEGYGVSVIYHCVFAHRRRSSWSAGSWRWVSGWRVCPGWRWHLRGRAAGWRAGPALSSDGHGGVWTGLSWHLQLGSVWH